MRKIKGITFHNTGLSLSAEECYQYLKLNGLLNLCHYLVDEKEVIETTPEYLIAFHTGKGYDKGNLNTIAIEICRSRANLNLYNQAERNAIKLAKKIMKQYGLKKYDIYFHCDFDNTSTCPHRTLEIYKTKKNFIKENFNEF